MLEPTWITHEWLRQIRKTHLPVYRFDDLRHTHAVHLLTSGVQPVIAKERLGYSTVGEMMNFYSGALRNERESAEARIEGLLAKIVQV